MVIGSIVGPILAGGGWDELVLVYKYYKFLGLQCFYDFEQYLREDSSDSMEYNQLNWLQHRLRMLNNDNLLTVIEMKPFILENKNNDIKFQLSINQLYDTWTAINFIKNGIHVLGRDVGSLLVDFIDWNSEQSTHPTKNELIFDV